jgi:hypothetical protein
MKMSGLPAVVGVVHERILLWRHGVNGYVSVFVLDAGRPSCSRDEFVSYTANVPSSPSNTALCVVIQNRWMTFEP